MISCQYLVGEGFLLLKLSIKINTDNCYYLLNNKLMEQLLSVNPRLINSSQLIEGFCDGTPPGPVQDYRTHVTLGCLGQRSYPNEPDRPQ